ncbi:hypothetical protein AB0869_05945 [Micromonospora vinacea]
MRLDSVVRPATRSVYEQELPGAECLGEALGHDELVAEDGDGG